MTAFLGMDTARMREHAERLRGASGEVEEIRARLDAAVRGVPWVGPDADTFCGRWNELSSNRLAAVCDELLALGDRGLGEAEQQDVASDADGADGGRGRNPSTIPRSDSSESSSGYRHADNPWLPDWLEDPLEGAVSGLAGLISDGIGRGFDTGIDLLEGGLGLFGVNTEGIGQFQRDADHFGGILEDWATGERVPTIAELGAAGLLAAGSAGVGAYEAITGTDTPLLDDRPGGIVESVSTDTTPTQGPQTLQDLVLENDALRLDNPGGPLENGQIGIQEVHRTGGGDPAYIVQVPPTEGAALSDVPGAYGEQGNSRDWGSNLRLVAGQHPAAMDDVRAAMESAGVPPGADVMIVGHSQGGIVANHLSADPSFNSATGEAGTYNVTHTFSVGSPVQTVVPAQGSTQSVNVNHEGGIGPGGISGDLIPALDLGGAQVDGGTLGAPNRHEVSLPGYPVPSLDPISILESNHDSVGLSGEAEGGYSGSVGRAVATDPTLSALERDLTGEYLGDGTYVAESHVVTVGRGEP
ncbi:WXG100 family type VII secretion target [Brachybacterium sp. AOP43-C2-M15]|uniref:WXG100 family type VII secretion target n=1 Tax=Brachybacterium sp. AOP43-C2-M15 TaxID=3457661 RepID=UPI004033173F